MTVSDMPTLNAGLNATGCVLLLAGLVAIRTGRKRLHAVCMGSAFAVSCLFLASYVLHKVLVRGVHTPFGGEGAWRVFYYVVLWSHVLLAMAIVPMAVITIRRALVADFGRHRRIAAWTWPVWMYVSVTGVLVYLMLYRWTF